MSVAKMKIYIINNAIELDKRARLQILHFVANTAGKSSIVEVKRGESGKGSQIDLNALDDDIIAAIYNIIRDYIDLLNTPCE